MQSCLNLRILPSSRSAVVALASVSILHAQTHSAKLEFEVASIKLAAKPVPPMLRQLRREAFTPGLIPMDDPVRVRLDDWTLLDLIAAAYRVRATDVIGPPWLADQGFDIEAKLPEGAPKEQVNAMLQSLLEDRFGLKVHRGSVTRQGFALAVAKDGAKLKPPDPARTADVRAREASANKERMTEMQQQGTPLTGLSRFTAPSITADGLANQLVRFAGAPVIDATGLTGKYSVVIETWKNPDVPGGTVFDAVAKLGLKLEPRKVTVETVMVDEVSKTPTAN